MQEDYALIALKVAQGDPAAIAAVFDEIEGIEGWWCRPKSFLDGVFFYLWPLVVDGRRSIVCDDLCRWRLLWALAGWACQSDDDQWSTARPFLPLVLAIRHGHFSEGFEVVLPDGFKPGPAWQPDDYWLFMEPAEERALWVSAVAARGLDAPQLLLSESRAVEAIHGDCDNERDVRDEDLIIARRPYWVL